MASEARYITLSEAAPLAPGQPHPSALWRWARRGVKTRTGDRLYLKTARSGRNLFTTPRWVYDFVEQLAEADRAAWVPQDNPAPDVKPGERDPGKRAEAVARAKERIGQ